MHRSNWLRCDFAEAAPHQKNNNKRAAIHALIVAHVTRTIYFQFFFLFCRLMCWLDQVGRGSNARNEIFSSRWAGIETTSFDINLFSWTKIVLWRSRDDFRACGFFHQRIASLTESEKSPIARTRFFFSVIAQGGKHTIPQCHIC